MRRDKSVDPHDVGYSEEAPTITQEKGKEESNATD